MHDALSIQKEYKNQTVKALRFTTLALLLNKYTVYKDLITPVILFADIRSTNSRMDRLSCGLGNQYE